jgi:hypothetical protein
LIYIGADCFIAGMPVALCRRLSCYGGLVTGVSPALDMDASVIGLARRIEVKQNLQSWS